MTVSPQGGAGDFAPGASDAVRPTLVRTRTNASDFLPEIVTITSGKGGVGKSNIAINLGILLHQHKQRVLLMDADLLLGKLDILIGITPRYTLADVLNHSVSLEDIIMSHPSGIDILPATSGEVDLIEADTQMLQVLEESFSIIQAQYDYLIVDTGAGVNRTVLSMALGADKVILVVTPEPASISDAYAMIKVIRSRSKELPIILVPNRLVAAEDGVELHKKLNLVTQKFLQTTLFFGGAIVEDQAVKNAVLRQHPFILESAASPAARNLKLVCRRLLKLPPREMKYRSNIFERLRVSRKMVGDL